MNESGIRKKRSRIPAGALLTLLLFGILYYAVFTLTGRGIPCIFRLLTGYLCPGCGMTHAVSALLAGQVRKAVEYNALSVTVLPVLVWYLAFRGYRYLRGEEDRFRVWELVLLVVLVLTTAAYGLIRNMKGGGSVQRGILFRILSGLMSE